MQGLGITVGHTGVIYAGRSDAGRASIAAARGVAGRGR